MAGRGSALRFRAGRGLCRRVVKAMTAGKNYPVTLTSYSSPKGRYHHPLNLLHLLNPLNPHAEGVSISDTITLGPKGPVHLPL